MDKTKLQHSRGNRTENKFSFFSALEKLFSNIQERPSEIVKERFGIKDGRSKTLEEIGRGYKITRERVRQIIKETIKKLKKTEREMLAEIEKNISFTIKQKNDIIKEERLLLNAENEKEKGSLKFLLELFDGISVKEASGKLEKSWVSGDFDFNEWERIKNEVKEILSGASEPLNEKDILEKLETSKKITIDAEKLFNYLDVSSEIKKGNFNKWGLAEWDEINPKGTREKIYLVLKETKKPLHFKEIASLIDNYKLNKKKNTHPQTVHNELIRDSRFILVGRGIYALSEWGYKEGTVKDVLEDILRKNNRPMERNEIMSKILSVRKVKKSTVLINLNNFFQKAGKNQYFIKK